MVAANEMPKGRLIVALAALFLSSMCTMGDLVISPIAANLYEVFAGEPEWLINFGHHRAGAGRVAVRRHGGLSVRSL